MKKSVIWLFVVTFSLAAVSDVPTYEMFFRVEAGYPLLNLKTPKAEVKLNSWAVASASPLFMTASMVPSKGLMESFGAGANPNDPSVSFKDIAKQTRSNRISLSGVTAGSGLLTLAWGTDTFRIRATEHVDPVEEFQRSPMFQAMTKEFGAEKAKDILFKRMVENWNVKAIIKKFYQEPLRSKAIKMADEEYEKLAPYKSVFGTNIKDQEAVIDAKVGQIVSLRIALEQSQDPQAKTAIEETIAFLRTVPKSDTTQTDENQKTEQATH